MGRLCLQRDDVGIVPYADFAHFPIKFAAPVGPRRAVAACRHFRPSAGGQCPPLRGTRSRRKKPLAPGYHPVSGARCAPKVSTNSPTRAKKRWHPDTNPFPARGAHQRSAQIPHAHEKASVSMSRDRGLLCGTTLVAPRCGTTRSAITGANRPRLRICARQTSGGCSGVIFTRRCTALHRPAALWIRGGRCLSPSRRLNFEFFTAFSGRNSVRIADLQTFSAFPAAGTRSGA